MKFHSCYYVIDFFEVVTDFTILRYHDIFKENLALNLNKDKFPSPQKALCQVWVEFVQKILKF